MTVIVRRTSLCSRPLPLGTILLGLSLLGGVSATDAQQPPTTPLVHEYFEYRVAPGDVGAEGGDLPTPGAVERGGPAAPAPNVVFTASGIEALDPDSVHGQNGALDAPVTLDRETEAEPRLSYAAVFRPTVAPLKRLGARDGVEDDGFAYDLTVRRQGWRPIAVEAAPADAAVDRFVGRMTVSGAAGSRIPIPSVAPEFWLERVVSVPRLQVDVVADGADNYAVVLSRDAEVDLELHVAAPQSYFGGPMPAGQPRPTPDVPARLARDARDVLAAIGVAADATDVEATEAMVRWFSGFEARPLPDTRRTNNVYLDLALSRIGVCRHRAQAFVLTALAAGLDARYVFNEAHAFVEVRLDGRWRRFDLGGASEGLDVTGASADDQHVPGDPPPVIDAPASAGASGPSLQSIVQPIGANTPAAVHMQGGTQVVTFEPAAPLRPDSRLVLDPTPTRVFRGDALRVSGRLIDASGVPAAGRLVDVHIGPRDRSALSEPIERLGGATTDDEGRFEATLTLPSLLPLGEWGLYVSFAGDDEVGPAPPPSR